MEEGPKSKSEGTTVSENYLCTEYYYINTILNIFVQSTNMDNCQLLIRNVSKRPQLYDFSLPLAERSRAITNKLWEEISNDLHGKIYYCSEP